MSGDAILVATALGVLALAMLYAFAGARISEQWRAWITRASAAAGAAFGIGMLLMGLPGALFLQTVTRPGTVPPPDSAWPLAIAITALGTLTILPASLLLRLVMPDTTGWSHVGATAAVAAVVTLGITVVLVGAYASA